MNKLIGTAAIALGASLAGCAPLPSSGPTANQIVRGERDQQASLGFKLVDLDATTIPPASYPSNASPATLAALATDGRTDLVGSGDLLSVTIYEVGVSLFGASSGTTIASGSAQPLPSPTAKPQSIAGILVRDDGTIRLPYVGRVKVAGHTTGEIESMIDQRLVGLSQRPQTVVTIADNIHNTVFVDGAVAKPGRIPLTLARERLLDAIAEAGGINQGEGPENTLVRFSRNGKSAEVYLSQINSDSAADLLLIPGDRINLVRRPRSFSVFGATDKVSQITFPTPVVSLAEAVANAGGPQDERADPTAIFVFRDNVLPDGETYSDVSANRATTATPAAVESAPVVYRLNLNKPSSYFVAQRFLMRDKDVIFIANARLNQTRKVAQIFSLLFTPAVLARQIR